MLKLQRLKCKMIVGDDSASSDNDDHDKPVNGAHNCDNNYVLQIVDNNNFDHDNELSLLAGPQAQIDRNGNANMNNEANIILR